MAAGLLPGLAQSAAHAHDAYDDEWHREQLAHIEQHVVLPAIAPFLLSISAALLSISVGVGMTSAAPEGVLARLETMSVGFC